MSRPTLGESPTERLHMAITAAELRAVDDWRYANRIQSRSEAIRQLLRSALSLAREHGFGGDA